jgi:hypothetical protein
VWTLQPQQGKHEDNHKNVRHCFVDEEWHDGIHITPGSINGDLT